MCDLSLSYLFQIYTATPLVFTHMYRVFISVLIKYLEWRCCEIELSRCTLISLWEQGGQTGQRDLEPPTWLLERHLLPTQILQKILRQSFQPRQLRDRRRINGRPHNRHWGFSPLSPSRPSVLVRLAHDGHRWIGGQSRKETEQREGFLCYCGCNSPFPSFTVPLVCICPPLPHRHWTGARWQLNKIIIICKQKRNLYTSCFFFLLFNESSFLKWYSPINKNRRGLLLPPETLLHFSSFYT